MTKRIMIGIADLTGRTVNTLRVGEMVSRYPAPRYAVSCKVCGTQTTETQARLTSSVARCQFGGCGKDALRETFADTPAKARQREQDAESAKRREREERQAAQLAEAEDALNETSRKLATVERERLTANLDPERFVDQRVGAGVVLSDTDARAFNVAEFDKFRVAHPEFHACSENLRLIGDYFERNRIQLATDSMWANVAGRMAAVHLLTERPTATTVPAPEPSNLTVTPLAQQKQQVGQQTFTGSDPLTGRDREFTQREIDLMSGDEFRRRFRVPLTLPNHAAF